MEIAEEGSLLTNEDALQDRLALTYGALLHDIGKVVYRGSSGKGTHSVLGARFLSDEVAPVNSDFEGPVGKRIIEQVRFHHKAEMAGSASLADDSLAYITYFADNISAGMDRKNEGDEEQHARFDKTVDLRKIFNILNGHHDDNSIPHDDYNKIRADVKRNLCNMDVSWACVGSMLNMLEATLSTVPSSTDRNQLVDVSLYDHAKTTAGIALCVYDYLFERGVHNYKEALFSRTATEFYAKPMFLLCSCDMSGIQDFIYNISGSGALKQLRARSLYLELLMENIVDELLDRLNLSRANLLYTGGGHALLLLPNTKEQRCKLEGFVSDLRAWFLEQYRTDLYLASACVECSADDLSNRGGDANRYRNLFRHLSEELSEKKASRYSASVLRDLNFGQPAFADAGRECSECHRSDLEVNAEGKCPLCSQLEAISPKLVRDSVFVVTEDPTGLVLPFGKTLVMYSRADYLKDSPSHVRVYTKNDWDAGDSLSTHIWMGDYTARDNGNDFAAYASSGVTLPTSEEDGFSLGVTRLGVLRADVDNLGITFVNGFPDEKVSISRTATLSRALSYFFKYEINDVLESGSRWGDGGYQLQIVYSGGDDLFVVGNWSDVAFAARDIRDALDKFTGNGSLTMSAGIGIYDPKYPLARMARETGSLEDAAKLYSDDSQTKNAVALWADDRVFPWDDFDRGILDRSAELRDEFASGASEGSERGRAYLYRLVSLLRASAGPVSAPRLAYLLARSFEDVERGDEKARRIYNEAQNARERRLLLAALEWYVYSTRERR